MYVILILGSHERSKDDEADLYPLQGPCEGDNGQLNQRIILHPKFNSKPEEVRNIYDVALVKLSKKIEFSSKLRPVCLRNRSMTGKTYFI